IPIHALLTENALADEFVSAFHARRLPEKVFYWFPLSVRAWLALCSDGAYRNFVRSRSLIARSGAELARLFPVAPLEVVRLGEVYAGEATVAGYDNPLNRRCAWAPLNAVGVRDTDGELVFEAADDARLPGLHLISKHFRAGRDVEALLGGEALRLARGERLAM